MNMQINAPDTKFIAPSYYTIIYWLGNVVIVAVGIIWINVIVEVNNRLAYSYGRQPNEDATWVVVGIIVGILLSLVVWRVTVELITVFFEQLRVTRQIREKLEKSLEIDAKAGSALIGISKLMPDIVAGISALQGQVASLESKVAATNSRSSNIATVDVKCPLCGRALEVPDGIEQGRHLQCPYCNGKFVFE